MDKRDAANYAAILALLQSKGGDINATTPEGETALMQASSQHTLGFVNLLLKDGADVNHADKEGNTALFKAIETAMSPEMGPEYFIFSQNIACTRCKSQFGFFR